MWGILGLVLMGRDMFSNSLIQTSVDGQGCIPSLLFDLRPNCRPMLPLENPGHPQADFAEFPVGLQSKIPWGFSIFCWIPSGDLQIPRAGSVVGPRSFLTV